jgi:hypothetical protein
LSTRLRRRIHQHQPGANYQPRHPRHSAQPSVAGHIPTRIVVPHEISSHRSSPENLSVLVQSQNGSTKLIELLARTGIYGTAETNVNRKIISLNTPPHSGPKFPALDITPPRETSAGKVDRPKPNPKSRPKVSVSKTLHTF